MLWTEDTLEEADHINRADVERYNRRAHRKWVRVFYAAAVFYAGVVVWCEFAR